jgi:hypothetical protein
MNNHKYIMRKPDGKGGWKYYYKNLSVKVKSKFDSELTFEAFNRVGFEERAGDFVEKSKKLKTRCKVIENEIAYKKDAEYCGILDDNGNVVFSKKGNVGNIEFDDDEARKIKNRKVLTHNHTKERGISPEDIFLALFLGIEETRAVFENKTFSFKVSYKKKSNNYKELKEKNKVIIKEIKKVTEEIQNKLQKFIKLKVISLIEANTQEQKLISKNISENKILKNILNMEYKQHEN